MKNRNIPLKAQKIEALLRRLPSTHTKRHELETELAKVLAGYRGEESLNYYLSLIDQDNFCIIHDLRLPDQNGYHFQLDTLIITPSFFLIIESKNYAGELQFDFEHQQLIRRYQDKEEIFPDPLVQVELQSMQLKRWLVKNKYPIPPIETLVIITNPTATIRTSSQNPKHISRLTRSSYLPIIFKQIQEKHQEVPFASKQLHKLVKLLVRTHSSLNPDTLQQFEINKEEISNGVHCPNCGFLPTPKFKSKWHCPTCHLVSRNAHIPSLIDYYLLFNPTISNKEIRSFLQIESRFVATNILTSLNLPSTGAKKARKYNLQPLYEKYHQTKHEK